jgi:Subtilase family
VKIAIIDSGIHSGHPHVGEVAGGISLVSDDIVDRLGHGTAVAGAIRGRAPDARLYAVKVFDRRLSTKSEILIRALEWCIAEHMDIVNMSLGSAKPISATPGLPIIVTVPGVIAGAITVVPDEACPRDQFSFRDGVFYASPYPRPIPGVPRENNFHGASFAVANMTGFVVIALAQVPRECVMLWLAEHSSKHP